MNLWPNSRKLSWPRAPLVILTLAISMSGGCGRDPSKQVPHSTSKAAQAEPTSHNDVESQIVHIPIGEFVIGSEPGEPGRHPETEPSATKLRLGPFRMDSRLVTNENGTARQVSSKKEAETLCARRQGRLCSEAEWERACRGPSSSAYPTGDAPCTKTDECRSGFDTLQMTQSLEWTSSTFGRGSTHLGSAVIRGTAQTSVDSHRRCAQRTPGATPKDAGAGEAHAIGFRCCYGAPNAATIEEPTLGPAYEKAELSVEQLRALLRADEHTSQLAAEAKFFSLDAAATVLARGQGETKGFELTTVPVIWQPAAGSKFLVLTGHDSHRTSFVLVYYEGKTQRKLAGSFLMKNESGPIALAYASSIRPRIHFSSCWGCPGETGKVLFREPEEIVLLQP